MPERGAITIVQRMDSLRLNKARKTRDTIVAALYRTWCVHFTHERIFFNFFKYFVYNIICKVYTPGAVQYCHDRIYFKFFFHVSYII